MERILKNSNHVLDGTLLVVKELHSAGAVQEYIQGSNLSYVQPSDELCAQFMPT